MVHLIKTILIIIFFLGLFVGAIYLIAKLAGGIIKGLDTNKKTQANDNFPVKRPDVYNIPPKKPMKKIFTKEKHLVNGKKIEDWNEMYISALRERRFIDYPPDPEYIIKYKFFGKVVYKKHEVH